jgi:hypothetical protein
LTPSLPISIVPVGSKPLGLAYGEWTVKWWQWLLSIPKYRSPAYDVDGCNAATRQEYLPVIFLCQTYENTGALPNRSIILHKNNLVFMPIINWISLQHHDGETDEELLTVAKRKMDAVANLKFTINGNPILDDLNSFRVTSRFFEVELPEDNIICLSPGIRRAISEGFWLFFEPLSDNLEIATFGSCSSGQTTIGVSYKIKFV